MTKIKEHYDQLARLRDTFRNKHTYYYQELFKEYRYLVPEGKRVLEVGCSTGDLLDAVKPAYGLGVDVSGATIDIAREKYKSLHFIAGTIDDVPDQEPFDYIILSGLIGELNDIQDFFEKVRRFCTKDTRVIIEYYSALWQYLLKAAEATGSKIPQQIQNWVTFGDVENFLTLAGYEAIKQERSMLFPVEVPVLSAVMNRVIAKLPLINELTLNRMVVARPLFEEQKEYSATILVPCRNEKGNIESAITRTPAFASHQEFIFVEGGSQDGTYEEVERVIKAYPDKDIKLFRQTGKGKGDAVRLGFDKATCDVLMILDADLTMPPEDLPKFYNAIRDGKGEFINGCRLVYPMEKEAMRLLNLIANKFFGLFFSWLLGQRYRDTLCGTKVMFKKQYDELVANRHYFGDFDPFGDFDLIFGATKLNLKVIELPIRYKDRTYGETQIQRFKHGILLFRMCWFAMKKIRFR